MATTRPAYLTLLESGELFQRVRKAHEHLASCDVCPLRCGVNRLTGELGICQTGVLAQVSSYGPHPGEERPLSGWRGSGTIFFARCNLRCVFCQNADISQLSAGREVNAGELAELMLDLQKRGCHNINLVSPSHVIPQILAAIEIAAGKGLELPIVYNTGGYDSLEMLALLEGVIDIYMPDMKYADPDLAFKYSALRITHASIRLRFGDAASGGRFTDRRAQPCLAGFAGTAPGAAGGLAAVKRSSSSWRKRSLKMSTSISWRSTVRHSKCGDCREAIELEPNHPPGRVPGCN